MRRCRNLELRIQLDKEINKIQIRLRKIYTKLSKNIVPGENRLLNLKEDIMIYMISIANIMKRYLNLYF